MRRECVQAVANALGRQPNQAEARDIELRVVTAARNLARKDPQGWVSKPKAQQLAEAGEQAAKEIIGEAQLKAERQALQLAAISRLDAFTADMQARGVSGLDAFARKIVFHSDGKANGLSLESLTKAVRSDLLRQLIPVMEASNPKWFGLLENREGVEAIIKELHGEDSGNPVAKAGAKVWHEVTEAARQRFNAAGGDIGKLDDWGMPHHHSQARVAKAGRDAWVAEVLPKLNRSKYVNEDGSRMTDAQLTEFLGEAWLTIATGGANKVDPGQARVSGARANRGSASRSIHFKDAQSYIDYQQNFGERSMYEVLTGHIEGIAKDIALVEEFGPNPDHVFRLQRDKLVQAAKIAEPTKVGKIDEQALKIENLYNAVSGKTQPVASQALANAFDTLRNWLMASRLGGAVISSITDEATLHLTGHLNNLPAMRLIANELATLNPANRMEERLANRAGLALQTMLASLNRFGQDGLGSNFSRMLANTVMRAQGLQAITDARRRAFGVTMMDALGSVVKDHTTLGKLDPKDAKLLKSKGVTDENFYLWKKAQLENWGGNETMLTPDSIYRISDADVDAAIAATSNRLQKLKDEANKQITELRDKDAEEQQWLANRAAGLQQWVADQRARLDKMIATADKGKAADLKALSSQLSNLFDRLDSAQSFWKDTKRNQISLGALHSAAKKEGAAGVRIAESKAEMSRIGKDLAKLRAELEGEFKVKWFEREQKLIERLESGKLDENEAMGLASKFDELFTEANARLSDRIAGADERATAKIGKLQDRLGYFMGRVQASQSLFEMARDAQPGFGSLRAQGVREGRAVEAAKGIRDDVRRLEREFEKRKKELSEDFAERWAKRFFEFKEFEQRSTTRATRRQKVIERINRELDPAIARMRTNAREQAATRLLAMVLEETDMAVIEPGARERALMGAGLQRGTWKGELTRSFFLFKSFPISMLMRHWGRAIAQPTGTGKAAYIAALMASTTVLGAVAMQIKEVLAGRDPRNLNPAKEHGVRNWVKAMLQGGSLGIYGDFLFSEASQRGQSALATSLGPVAGIAEETLKLTQGNVMEAAAGMDTHAGAEVVKFIQGNTPGANLWYAKAALDHLIFHQLQEHFSPGYLSKMRRRAERDFGTRYWWEPGETLPDRAPDLSNAVQ